MSKPHAERGRRHLWWALALLTCVAAVGIAQTPPTFHTEVNFIRVDVFATRGGTPVADLVEGDFEVFDENVPQRIDEFRRVVLPLTRSTASPRVEPRTVSASREAAADPSARVFVLFLDRQHVDRGASRRIQKPLEDALTPLVGPDDVIAMMTPEMVARDMTFTRSAATIDPLLARFWGVRDETGFSDPVEQRYAQCYPGIQTALTRAAPDQGIAQEMILRRREGRTLDALDDLVKTLRDLKEERKTVLLVTNGWRLYGPSGALARPIDGVPPAPLPPVAVDPRSGRLTTAPPTAPAANGATLSVCDLDRQTLAQVDNRARFRQLLDEANRANVSFYPVDPRGLATFDEDIVPAAGVGSGPLANPTVPIDEDLRRLNDRHESLRTMAIQTDGLALVEHSNLAAGLQRIAADVSAYYLLGYYSTTKLDGKFHAIRVRVTKPGIEIRARRGYLAGTVAATDATRPATPPAGTGDTAALAAALGGLGTLARESSLRVRAAAAYAPSGVLTVAVMADGARGSGSPDDWTGGGEADAMLVDTSGTTLATGHARIDPGAMSVRVGLSAANVSPGDYEVRIRTRAQGGAPASSEGVSLAVSAAPVGSGTLFFRRGPATGNREAPTADPRFRRSERLRLDVPARGADGTQTARLLDRLGKPMPVPVAASTFVDADGARWTSAQLALAPLAPGDYVIEVTAGGDGSDRALAAFRIVP